VKQAPLHGLFLLAVYAIIFPKISVAGVGLGLDDILTLFVLPCMLFHILANPARHYVWEFWVVLLLFLAFIGIYFVLGSWSNYQRLGAIRFPTELWQYAKRLAFFLFGFFFILNVNGSEIKAPKILLIAYAVILLVGAFQLFGGVVGDFLAQIYGRTDSQIERLVERSFSAKRVFGTAGNPNAWGGFSLFVFTVTLAFFLNGEAVPKRRVALLGGLAGLALLNILFSGSRGAMLGLGVVLMAMFVWYLLTIGVRSTVKLATIGVAMLFIFAFIVFFQERIQSLLFRFSVLIETMGGGRDEQIKIGLLLLDGAKDYWFGASNHIQRALGVSHGVEVEPIYLFINYGAFGVFILFVIMATLTYSGVRMALLNFRYARPLGVSLVIAILGYAVFSLGFFFFQELVVGTPFWLYAGVVLGCYHKISCGSNERKADVGYGS